MAKKSALVAFILVAVVVSFSGCRGYGYRTCYAGGPHIDYLPEWTFPLYTTHRPVPHEELKEVYPPDSNISTK